MKSLKIIKISASNFMCLKAGFEIILEGNSATLTGKNGAGKSAVLNLVSVALLGKSALPDRPIRVGASKAEGAIDLGDLVISIACTEASGFQLTAKDKSGISVKSPRTVLDALWNSMLDPQKFVRLSDTPEGQRKQAEILRQIVGLDSSKLDAEKKKNYDARTLANRDLQTAKGKLVGLKHDDSAPAIEVSATALTTELEGILAHNRTIEERKSSLEADKALHKSDRDALWNKAKEIEEAESKVKALRGEADTLENKIASDAKEILAEDAAVAKLEIKAEALIRTKIAEADSVNARVRANSDYKKQSDEVSRHEATVNELTESIDTIDEQKRSMLAKMKFPLPELSFSEDGGLLMNNLPFDQASQAQQSKAAVAIGMELNPRIAVVLIREASLYDKDTKLAIVEMASRKGFQVIEEVVESDDPAAIVIQDGEVKEEA